MLIATLRYQCAEVGPPFAVEAYQRVSEHLPVRNDWAIADLGPRPGPLVYRVSVHLCPHPACTLPSLSWRELQALHPLLLSWWLQGLHLLPVVSGCTARRKPWPDHATIAHVTLPPTPPAPSRRASARPQLWRDSTAVSEWAEGTGYKTIEDLCGGASSFIDNARLK